MILRAPDARFWWKKGTRLYLLSRGGGDKNKTVFRETFSVFWVHEPVIHQANQQWAGVLQAPWDEKRHGFVMISQEKGDAKARSLARASRLVRLWGLLLYDDPEVFQLNLLD